MVVQSLWQQSEYYQVNDTESSCFETVTSVVQALDRLPDFSQNLALTDELRDRQTGLITKGDGYIAPKADQLPRIMEAIEVEKIV